MSKPEAFEIERAQAEYQHAVSELARYDRDSQKLFASVSFTLTAAFGLGITKEEADIVFVIIPILTLVVIQYLLSNNYAYRVREKYVCQLEEFLGSCGTHTPRLYHKQIKHFYFNLGFWNSIVHPFSGTIAFTMIVMLIMSTYCVTRALEILEGSYDYAYLSLCAMMLIYSITTAIWSINKLKQNFDDNT